MPYKKRIFLSKGTGTDVPYERHKYDSYFPNGLQRPDKCLIYNENRVCYNALCDTAIHTCADIVHS